MTFRNAYHGLIHDEAVPAYSVTPATARLQLASGLLNGSIDAGSHEEHRRVLNFVLVECRVPTPTLADTLQVSIGTLERWASGEVEPDPIMVRTTFSELPTLLKRDIPVPFEREKALRVIKMMAQSHPLEARKMLATCAGSDTNSLDIYDDETFRELLNLMLNHCSVEVYDVSKAMDVSMSAVLSWLSPGKEPLARTRRKLLRYMSLLHASPTQY